jgi:hypothetical protein
VLIGDNSCAIEKSLDSELKIKCEGLSETSQNSPKQIKLKIYENGLNEQIISNFYEVVYEEPILTHLNDKTFNLTFDEEIDCLNTSTVNILSANFNIDIDHNKRSLKVDFENEITEPYLSIDLMGIIFNLEIQRQISKVNNFLTLVFEKFKISCGKLFNQRSSLFTQHCSILPKTTLCHSSIRGCTV